MVGGEEYQVAGNYIRPCFQEYEATLKKLSLELSQEIRTLGLKCDPIVKSYHLTLAYQFQQTHFSGTSVILYNPTWGGPVETLTVWNNVCVE